MAPSSTTLFVNGQIETMDPTRATASAMLVEGGRITVVAADPAAAQGLVSTHPEATTVELGGQTVIPGFVDSHNHLSIAALYPRWADLSAISDEQELYRLLSAQAAEEPDTPWIRGANWNGAVSPVRIDRDLLDSFNFPRPVMISDMSLHEGVVDSQGLDQLAISEATSDPPAGLIGRDQRGRPTGYLLERAWSAGHASSMAGYDDPDRWGELIAERAQSLLAEGITAIHDAACSPQAEQTYRSLAQAGKLPISVLSMPHPAAILDADLGDRLNGPITGEGNEWFRIGPVKLFADGGRHAAVGCVDNPSKQGSGIYFDDIAQWIPRIAERGFRVAVHAVGDFAIRGCLNAFDEVAARAPGVDHRFRIEHAIRPVAGQIAAMKDLGVVACVQPGLVSDYGDGLMARAGPDSGDHWFPFRTMQQAGIPLAASSDDPCAPLAPIVNAVSAATRRTRTGTLFGASQTMPLRDWIHAYTAGSAYAGGQENERGTLSVGKQADLVVLNGPLDEQAPPAITQTWVAGVRVWSAEPRNASGQ